jgi:hypothetical protein
LGGCRFKASLEKKLTRPPSQQKSWMLGVGGCTPSYAQSLSRTAVQASPGKNTRLYSKKTKAKRAGGMAQVVEHLLSNAGLE